MTPRQVMSLVRFNPRIKALKEGTLDESYLQAMVNLGVQQVSKDAPHIIRCIHDDLVANINYYLLPSPIDYFSLLKVSIVSGGQAKDLETRNQYFLSYPDSVAIQNTCEPLSIEFCAVENKRGNLQVKVCPTPNADVPDGMNIWYYKICAIPDLDSEPEIEPSFHQAWFEWLLEC